MEGSKMRWPSVLEHVKAKVALYRNRPLLRDAGGDASYTYEEFDVLTDRVAGGLRAIGLQRGDRVALLHPNHTDLILAYFGVIKGGGVVVPVNPLYTSGEILRILKNSGARWLISSYSLADRANDMRSSAPALERVLVKGETESLEATLERECGALQPRPDEKVGADDLAFIFYTSGTTGEPKGVMLTHRNVVFGGGNTAQNYGLREDDVALVCLPLVHVFANASPLLGTLNSGGCVVVIDRFQTEPVFHALERHRVTWFSGVPTMFGYLLNAFRERSRSIPALRMGLSGGASLSAEHLARFEEMFEAPVVEVYGLTESTGLVTGNPVYGVRKAGSIGVNASGVSARLVDESGRDTPRGEVGEIIFRGPNTTPGYWNKPEATNAAIREGWMHTGDLARQDVEGYYFIVGRKDELIISGGYNIYPREVEEVLYLHEEIAEAAVVGVADPNLGQVLTAFVAPRSGHRLVSEEIRAFCAERLAAYKVPRRVEIMAELPKNSTGKILKKSLPGV
ncbi:MAG: AMP-binding protein [Thermodesulfobacteriota bacterium]